MRAERQPPGSGVGTPPEQQPGATGCRHEHERPCPVDTGDPAPLVGLELNFKGGQVGGPDYFQLVADGRSVT